MIYLQPKLSLPAAQRVVNGEWATGVRVEGREEEGQSPRQAKTSQSDNIIVAVSGWCERFSVVLETH